jgi:hypothetical protein
LLPADRTGARALRYVTSPLLELLDYIRQDKGICRARIKRGGRELVADSAF